MERERGGKRDRGKLEREREPLCWQIFGAMLSCQHEHIYVLRSQFLHTNLLLKLNKSPVFTRKLKYCGATGNLAIICMNLADTFFFLKKTPVYDFYEKRKTVFLDNLVSTSRRVELAQKMR